MTLKSPAGVVLPSQQAEIRAYAEQLKLSYYPKMHEEVIGRLMNLPNFFEVAGMYFSFLEKPQCLITYEFWLKRLNDVGRQKKLLDALVASRYDLPPKDLFLSLPPALFGHAWTKTKLTHHQIESLVNHYAYVSHQPERIFDIIHYLAPLTSLPLNVLMLTIQLQALKGEKLPPQIEADAHAFFSGKRPSHYAPRVLLLRTLYARWTEFLEPWRSKTQLNAKQSDRLLALYLAGIQFPLPAQEAQPADAIVELVQAKRIELTPTIFAHLKSVLSGHQLAEAVGPQA
jgi:hypothetical protein